MTSAEPRPTFPFFVGCGRSGTTLLRAMFDARADLAIPDEVAFIIRYSRPHYASRYGWPRRFDAAACAWISIAAHSSFRRWDLPEGAVLGLLSPTRCRRRSERHGPAAEHMRAAHGPRQAARRRQDAMHGVLYLRRLARLFRGPIRPRHP